MKSPIKWKAKVLGEKHTPLKTIVPDEPGEFWLDIGGGRSLEEAGREGENRGVDSHGLQEHLNPPWQHQVSLRNGWGGRGYMGRGVITLGRAGLH